MKPELKKPNRQEAAAVAAAADCEEVEKWKERKRKVLDASGIERGTELSLLR